MTFMKTRPSTVSPPPVRPSKTPPPPRTQAEVSAFMLETFRRAMRRHDEADREGASPPIATPCGET